MYLLVHRRSPALRALTVVFSVGLADGFVGEQTWLGSSNPWKSPDRSPPGNTRTAMVSTSSWPARHRGTGPIGIGSRAKNGWHGLGSLDLSLKDARIKRDAARQEVGAGVDVVQTKRLAREGAGAEAAVAAATTFKERTERYIKDNEAKWSKKHAAQWPSSLKQYACRATFSSCSSRFGSRSARRRTASAGASKR